MYMFTHELKVLKGFPNPYALDKVVELDTATHDAEDVLNGMVGHKAPAAAGRLQLGLPLYTGITGVAPMPLFCWSGGAEFDVQVDADAIFGVPGATNSTGSSSVDAAAVTGPVLLRPKIGTYVATGAFELASTEFAGTPTTGQLLTSPTTGGDTGNLVVATNGTIIPIGTICCGVVSDGVRNSTHVGGPQVLHFWPCYTIIQRVTT